MHTSSVSSIELVHFNSLTTAVKSLKGQTMRELSRNPVRQRSPFLRTPFYEIVISSDIVGVDKEFINSNFTEVISKLYLGMKDLGYFKLKAKYIDDTHIRVRLYFSREAIFK